jgi:uncharacterized protein YbjT (DUF2867 family)
MGITASVVGATGLVGTEVTVQLCSDPDIDAVHVLVRRAITDARVIHHPKLVQHIIDFEQLTHAEWSRSDVLFCCLGTTIKVAGSQAAFRRVDFDYVVESARWAKQSGVSYLAVISAIGANSQSNIFYNRIKGEMEAAVAALGFDTLVIMRPSLLAGKRSELRVAERFTLMMAKIAGILIPMKYRPIPADAVARAMIAATKNNVGGTIIIESDKLQHFR